MVRGNKSYSASAIALPTSVVLALPPMSPVRGAPDLGSSTFSIALRIAPGLASASRRHVAAETLLWARGAARLEGGISLHWRL